MLFWIFVAIACSARGDRCPNAADGRPLVVTIEAPLEDEWLNGQHSNRQHLESLGVDRLMLTWTGNQGTEAIHRAGQVIKPR